MIPAFAAIGPVDRDRGRARRGSPGRVAPGASPPIGLRCASHGCVRLRNLNGDPKAAKAVLASDRFGERRLVSKNVCHGVSYDAVLHERVLSIPEPGPGLRLIIEGMAAYLARSPEGKKFHDPLAACCAIDPSIATWAEVEVYREKGKWGSRLCPGSGTWIIVDYDYERFVDVLTRV